jgi:hypothetical protein
MFLDIEELREKIQHLKFKYVVVSPMKRAITTAIWALKYQKNIKSPKYIIHPFLSACLSGTMDIPSQSLESGKDSFLEENLDVEIAKDELESFSDYRTQIPKHLLKRTSLLKFFDLLFTNPKYYFLNFFDERMQKDLILAFSKNRDLKINDYLVKKIETSTQLEDKSNFDRRVGIAKNYLNTLIPTLGEDEHILVVTHSKFTKRFCQLEDRTKNHHVSVKNGEPYFMSHLDFTLKPNISS